MGARKSRELVPLVESSQFPRTLLGMSIHDALVALREETPKASRRRRLSTYENVITGEQLFSWARALPSCAGIESDRILHDLSSLVWFGVLLCIAGDRKARVRTNSMSSSERSPNPATDEPVAAFPWIADPAAAAAAQAADASGEGSPVTPGVAGSPAIGGIASAETASEAHDDEGSAPGDLFDKSEHSLYRLVCDDKNANLNMQMIFTPPARDANVVSAELRKQLLRLYGRFLGEDGRSVQREAMLASDEYAAFVEAVAELQWTNLAGLTNAARKAFLLNVYNVLTVHGMLLLSGPSTLLGRATFFKRARYTIGLLSFSLDDIEHGLLRCNRDGHMAPDDVRLRYALDQPDHRIHFALNCGAESCPPIRVYTPQGIDAELQRAAASFCQQEFTIKPDADGVVLASKIFHWYARDFGANDAEIVACVAPYLTDEVRARLAQRTDWVIEHKAYSWKAL